MIRQPGSGISTPADALGRPVRIAVDGLTAQSREFPDQIVSLTEVGWLLAFRKEVIVAMLGLTV
jgi:hypothetical protein